MTAQLMIGVDATILALAVPDMAAELEMSTGATAWVMAGYVLAAGSLMIAGGRVAQAVGYTRTMTIGLLLFGVASAVGGAAHADWMVIAARVGQGVGAAAMTPAGMARLSAAFPDEGRGRAYGVFGMIMGSGTAIGLLLGGLLTQVSGWRACMDVNVVFVAVSLILSVFARDRAERSSGHGRGWWRSVLLAAGAASIIYALTSVDSPGSAVGSALVGVVVTGVFIAVDRRSRSPLIPGELFRDPARRVAYLGLFLWGVATITTFVAASRSLQDEYRLPPLAVGAMFLVYPVAIQVGLLLARRAAAAPGTRSIGIGLALIGAGQVVFAVSPEGLGAVLAALVLMGLGTSQVMPNANSAMNRDAGPHAGVAGAVGTTLQQLGGSVGLAVPVALAAATTYATSIAAGATALVLLVGSVLACRQSTSRALHAPRPDVAST
ncbi:MFS transporter [Pseudonocardia sp. WMMC193]|uniref:MFS transporter n=1 Tax=Pseudonocardia sp. WMMC193 TaxID=2911965 RepID=UPI001F01BB41|nr:MFS transporter [Pseudonocardia sp. WMMC193]MCF7553729.1 MFS transporter [Pseudonocardia sp. WMMC193]